MHVYQKCIRGRNSLDNVLILDARLHEFAMQNRDFAAGIFLDFANAFPSIFQSFLWAVLKACGFSDTYINAIKALYENNVHIIKIGGKLFFGPTILLGIKQGCPLSRILFTICLEPFLRKLEQT